MKLTKYKEGQQVELTTIALAKDAKQRLMFLGIYEGAIVRIEKQGGASMPSMLLVCGNLWMIRAKDLAMMEGELIS